jgi:hypothetical protein
MTPTVVKDFKNIILNLELTKVTSSASAIYKGIFCLLARKGARDFNSWDLPEYAILDDHHLVPKSWGEKNAPDLIHSIVNRTPLADNTNRRILRDRLPNIYLAELIKKHGRESVVELLATHLISEQALDVLLRSPFTVSDFKEFLEIRQKAILQEIEVVSSQQKLK